MIQPHKHESRSIRTLLAMACDGGGPSQTCINIMSGAYRAGYVVDIFANRRRIKKPEVPMILSLPGPILAQLPYRRVVAQASRILESRFLRSIQPDDIAYLWPAASLEIHRRLYERGIPVVMEGINTRMASARKILDNAYEDFGVEPSHGITDKRIAEEEEKYHYAKAIFAPNKYVENALIGSPLEGRILSSSYGVDTKKASPPREYPVKKALTFVFCGYACVRKGMHFLLDVWQRIPGPHRLQIIGNVEPIIAERYATLLNSDRVELVGFVDDVHRYFAQADAFLMPSLEEGGPQVTYEAAVHGLPIIASPMGASRLGDEEGTMLIVEPSDRDAFEDALDQVIRSVELRRALGRRACERVPYFDWNAVGARRAEQLQTTELLAPQDGSILY